MDGDEIGENKYANFFIYLLKDSIKMASVAICI